MKSTGCAALLGVLKATGKPAHRLRWPDGSVVCVLPHGGRILGLYAGNGGENFLWTHDALRNVATATALYESDQWHNSGGDRTWLAPELDFFFPQFPDLSRYRQPRQFDPGNYRMSVSRDGVELSNRFALTSYRSRRRAELRVTKRVSPAPNPLRHETCAGVSSDVAYAGYTMSASLMLVSAKGARKFRAGLWNLLQLPHGGELLIPTCGRTKPKVFFGDIPAGDMEVTDHLTRYRMRAKGVQKIGIRAVAATGRAGYVRRSDDGRWTLVIRNFFVNPSGEYVDVPWDNAEDVGYAVQACNVNNAEFGRFGELEYHAPGLDQGAGLSEDISQVWAFRGDRKHIASVARRLLGGI